MADPRFFNNRGPVSLKDLCAGIGAQIPSGADETAQIFDLAGLAQAGAQHLSCSMAASAPSRISPRRKPAGA